ncbi:hypothetical protein DPM13_15410 [Paracoccus mutanolyticus]|uniref:Aldehyde dehydrogenase domain-containing protein n=1 Tax=Paracoccus mutanolyticus TaxID=1499308 RepID=A0ABM6WTG3_9RHOB|nr:aldehyde dehydrogenase family protein [Paracoccus mutanolyticus]AWX93913.1 hypothetical protein DPM13_15410 [Paracoccus mutanolyticus]
MIVWPTGSGSGGRQCRRRRLWRNGEICTASSRLIEHTAVPCRREIMRAFAFQHFGHALAEGTQLGHRGQRQAAWANARYIAKGRAEGARATVRGQRLNRETPGFYLSPTLFTETRNDMRINREEVFGPVASVIRVADYDEALAVANDTPVWPVCRDRDPDPVARMVFPARLRAGCGMINSHGWNRLSCPLFGGRGASSYGPREQGRYAAEFYTIVKTSYMHRSL